MAVQQLTQPILNPIAAFDASRANTVSFVVIGGAQVIANRLVITNNRTGSIVYNQIQSTMKLEHNIPANLLVNGTYYNAVVYTIDSANNESVGSTPIPFYCYTQPTLTIDNMPSSEIIENGTYEFKGTYAQVEGELLDSYQYTLYDSNRNVLSRSPLIYYNADSSLAYTFVGMSNDTSYYVTLTGETINGTQITTGFLYFSVRYIQPASFAICDLVNNCENGYIQISSNVIAIDGKSNPSPPIYIDDKEVDLRDPESWVRWNEGFNIKDDFTMRVWGRDFNDNSKIITLTNEQNTYEIPNKIELKWMIGNIVKTLPEYNKASGNSIYLDNSKADQIKNLSIEGNSVQYYMNAEDFGTKTSHIINSEKIPLNINVQGNHEQIVQKGSYSEVEGEYIHVEDVDSTKPGDIIVKGNAYQQQTTQGKNYFTGDKVASGTGVGVSYSFNNSVLTLNGTSTGVGSIRSVITTGITMPETAPQNGYICTARILSGDVTIPSGKDYAIYLRDVSSKTLFNVTGTNIKRQGGIEFNKPDLAGKELYIQIFVNSANLVFNNLQIAIQIEENTPQNWFDSTLTPENYFYNAQGEKTSDTANLYINQEFTTRGSFTFTYDQRYGGVSVFLRLCEYQADGTFIKRTLITDKNITVTLDSNTAKVITSTDWDIQGGKYFPNPQLTSTNNYTDFDQYIPNSPTPDYPSKVETVGNNINLFNFKDKKNVSPIYTVDDEGWITCQYDNTSGTSIAYLNYYTNNLNLKTGVSYNVIVEVKNSSGTGRLAAVSTGADSQFDTTFNILLGTNFTDVYNSVLKTRTSFQNSINGLKTFTTFNPGQAGSITFRISVLEDTSVDVNNFVYSNYNEGSVQITKSNKNFAVRKDGIWYNSNTQLIQTGNTGYAFIAEVKENSTITISKKNAGNRFVVITSKNKITHNTQYSRLIIARTDSSTTTYTFNTNAGEKYVFFGYYLGTDETQRELSAENVQIEISNTATSYVAHQSVTVDFPLQQEMLTDDYIDWSNNNEVHNWNKIIFDGTENWRLDRASSRFYYVLPIKPKTQGIYNSYCNHFKYGNTEITNECYNTGSTAVFIRYEQYTALDTWKAWLKSQYDANIPVILYYKIETPTTLALNSEQLSLKSQLVDTVLYEGITDVSNESSYPAILDLRYNIIRDMPSPDYPSKIETVGNNINEIDWNKCEEGKVWTENGKTNNIATWAVNDYQEVNTKNITISFNSETPDNNSLGRVLTFDENKTLISNLLITKLPYTVNFADAKYYTYYFVSKFIPFESELKIEKGAEATAYSKPGQGSVKVNISNKNLLYYDVESQTNSGISYTVNADKSIKVQGTATALNDFYLVGSATTYKSLGILGEYKLNGCTSGSTNEYMLFVVKKDISGNLSYYQQTGADLNVVIKEGDTFRIFIRVLSNVSLDDVVYPMLRLSTETDNSYVECQQQTAIMSIQQEMLEGDTFTLGTTSNKKENHTWGKVIFDGSENWTLSGKGYIITTNYVDNVFTNRDKTKFDGYCNYFKVQNNSQTWTEINYCGWNAQGVFWIREDHNIANNVNDFKTWLQSKYNEGNPVIVYYKIVTPTTLSCTTEQSQILDKLTNNISYEPQTNITTTNGLALLNVQTYGLPYKDKPSELFALGDRKNLIDISDFNLSYSQEHNYDIKTDFILKPDFIYTLSFNYTINQFTTDIYYSVGYGTDGYMGNLEVEKQYESYTSGKNFISFIVPDNIPGNSYLWIRFAKTNILSNVDIDISNVQLESGNKATSYTPYRLYSINPTVVGKNLYNYDRPLYLIRNNIDFSGISQGYNIKPTELNSDSYLGIGFKNNLKPGQTYSISFEQDGNYSGVSLYYTKIESEEIVGEIPITNNTFVAPQEVFDLQLAFSVDSSDLSNYLEIWNVQFEHGSSVTEYENRESNDSTFLLQQQVRGMLGKYKDLICLESPNILNPDTKSASVSGSTEYYINQLGDTEYYIWYYNSEGNLITFLDDEGIRRSGVVIKKGSFITHENCVKITITKYGDPDADDISKDEILNNHISIYSDGSIDLYYPYISKPSAIRYIGRVTFDGVNTKFRSQHSTISTTTNNFFQMPVPDKKNSYNGSSDLGLCNYLKFIPIASPNTAVQYTGLWWEANTNYCYASLPFETLEEANQWLINLNASGNPLIVDFVLEEPAVYDISTDAINALKSLKTFEPISNVFTDNDVLGNIKLEYVFNYSEQETQNNYVLLRCWNTNSMPYICHSNYIDMPDEKDKIFIWMRRKNNLFDLKIENLGDYNEDDKPTDRTKPVVTLQIDDSLTTTTTITAVANSIDDNGLRAVRFSKDNGNTWDEVIQVDGLSSTNVYTFENLKPNTAYVIRAEAIDLAGNIGGISQNVMTKS